MCVTLEKETGKCTLMVALLLKRIGLIGLVGLECMYRPVRKLLHVFNMYIYMYVYLHTVIVKNIGTSVR